MSSTEQEIPFNDLFRIHQPLLGKFHEALEKIVTNSNFVLGQEVEGFEKSLCKAEDSQFAVCLNSGTSALELALRACGVREGDEVITTALTFVATCFAILQTGARPVLVDIESNTGLMNIDLVRSAITKKTKAVVFVTLHGRVDGLEDLNKLCSENGLQFIIDSAQSHLGTFDNKAQANFCDAATLSFYPGKNLGALGEGGAVLTNSRILDSKIRMMRDWGAIEKYSHSEWGGNFRLEPIQAAFLNIKINKLHEWTEERRKIANSYHTSISPKLLMQEVSPKGSHVFHIFSILTNSRDSFISNFKKYKIGHGIHYPKAIHQNTWYQDRVIVPKSLENAEKFAKNTLSIPLFPGQTDEEVARVITLLNKLANN
jgi:dTDP-4-amino-4,6-dideoxygalactose transaminase